MERSARGLYVIKVALGIAAAIALLSFLPHSFAYASEPINPDEPMVGVPAEGTSRSSSSDGIAPINTEDWYLGLRLDQDTTYGSQIRQKDNSSSVYVNVTGRPNICMLYTDGFTDAWGSNRRNCTNGGGASLQDYGKFEIYNSVNEWGYSHVQITALRTGDAYAVTGSWSPDYAYDPAARVLNP